MTSTTPERSLPFGRPMLDAAEEQAVLEVLRSGMLVHGKATAGFEEAFADRCGVKHAIAVSSCTAGLHLTLFVRGIGPGDRVAVPAMTHVATAHSVELLGAEPVFVDADPVTGNMDPDKLDAVEGNLTAVIPVHYLGLPCAMDRIGAAAAARSAFVLEDCALSVDATFAGKKTGSIGLAGSFSFYPVKHMTSIEGGMVTTNDDELAAQIRKRRAFGYNRALGERARPGLYDVDVLGFNYRMNEVEAAVGLCQIAKLDGFQEARRRNEAIIRKHLADLDRLHLFPVTHGPAVSSRYCLNIVLPKDGSIARDVVVDKLKTAGIGTSVHYPGPVPLFTYFREKYGHLSGDFPVAEWLAEQTISLPVGPHLSADDAEYLGRNARIAFVEAGDTKQGYYPRESE